ncbi:hypothetical protein HNQ77_001126 [Silvibacterium bohemicum]|uniref:Uncharacterized protein n=1 Tax=Silvibacterium bohemicum TaxID=1577686 RepID=A0A841JP87_9BACT|nr:hypothetical protein [Silvibacterium bohemicum]MBB6143182.1 hypothetical protein [Silvibacterium bohemicum]
MTNLKTVSAEAWGTHTQRGSKGKKVYPSRSISARRDSMFPAATVLVSLLLAFELLGLCLLWLKTNGSLPLNLPQLPWLRTNGDPPLNLPHALLFYRIYW